jgi:hypothetical protein
MPCSCSWWFRYKAYKISMLNNRGPILWAGPLNFTESWTNQDCMTCLLLTLSLAVVSYDGDHHNPTKIKFSKINGEMGVAKDLQCLPGA